MELRLENQNRLLWQDSNCPAVIGKGSLIPEQAKKEGDGATPTGNFVLRRVLYRNDRVERPITALPCRAITLSDGWCDAPLDPAYNRPVSLPYPASTEKLFRDDHLYDLLVVLGHNDHPPKAGLGCAIFFHLARGNGSATRGCIAVAKEDMLSILRLVTKSSFITIPAP